MINTNIVRFFYDLKQIIRTFCPSCTYVFLISLYYTVLPADMIVKLNANCRDYVTQH